MAKLISEFILKKSFTRFGYKVLIRNENSHTLLTKTDLISIIELKTTGLVLEVPVNTCQKNHQLTLFFLPLSFIYITKLPDVGRYKESIFEGVVKVDNIEKNANKEGAVFIDVHFTQYKTFEWESLLRDYADNQEEISNMILRQHDIRDKK